jgi:hypothetical protein
MGFPMPKRYADRSISSFIFSRAFCYIAENYNLCLNVIFKISCIYIKRAILSFLGGSVG